MTGAMVGSVVWLSCAYLSDTGYMERGREIYEVWVERVIDGMCIVVSSSCTAPDPLAESKRGVKSGVLRNTSHVQLYIIQSSSSLHAALRAHLFADLWPYDNSNRVHCSSVTHSFSGGTQSI